jgi:hypothetical protein
MQVDDNIIMCIKPLTLNFWFEAAAALAQQ